jgi:hypothetical protein
MAIVEAAEDFSLAYPKSIWPRSKELAALRAELAREK